MTPAEVLVVAIAIEAAVMVLAALVVAAVLGRRIRNVGAEVAVLRSRLEQTPKSKPFSSPASLGPFGSASTMPPVNRVSIVADPYARTRPTDAPLPASWFEILQHLSDVEGQLDRVLPWLETAAKSTNPAVLGMEVKGAHDVLFDLRARLRAMRRPAGRP